MSAASEPTRERNDPPSQTPGARGELDPHTFSQLAGGLAHELKNPLSTLGLHLSLLREAWEGDEDPRARRTVRSLDTLQAEVGRLEEILDDFLRFARTDRIELQRGSLNVVVEQVLDFVEPEASARGITVERFLDFDLPQIDLDSARMRQALLNLVVNARQAMDESGGRITVITRREGEEAVLEVVDDGPGMRAEDLERAFEVYWSTKSNGSGLGLPTVRRIVETHGGSLALESSPQHGTRAAIRLPIPPAAPA